MERFWLLQFKASSQFINFCSQTSLQKGTKSPPCAGLGEIWLSQQGRLLSSAPSCPHPLSLLAGEKETSINIALEFCLQMEGYLISTFPPAEVSSQPSEATQQRRSCPSNTARHLEALNRAWEQFSLQRSSFLKQFVMIRGESHVPVYTESQMDSRGTRSWGKGHWSLGHMDTLGSQRIPSHQHLLLQGTTTTAVQWKMGFTILGYSGWYVPNPKIVPIKKATVWKSFLLFKRLDVPLISVFPQWVEQKVTTLSFNWVEVLPWIAWLQGLQLYGKKQ